MVFAPTSAENHPPPNLPLEGGGIARFMDTIRANDGRLQSLPQGEGVKPADEEHSIAVASVFSRTCLSRVLPCQ